MSTAGSASPMSVCACSTRSTPSVGFAHRELRIQRRRLAQPHRERALGERRHEAGEVAAVGGSRRPAKARQDPQGLHVEATMALKVRAVESCRRRRLPQVPGRSERSHADTSAPRSSCSTSAEPTTTPSTWPRSRATCSRLRMPKPAHTGSGEAARTRVQVVHDLLGHRDVLAGGAGHGHRVHESLAAGAQLPQSLGLGDRRHHLHQRQALRHQRRAQLAALIERQVRHDEAGDAGAAARARRASRPKASSGFR